MEDYLSYRVRQLQAVADDVARQHIAPCAEEVDRECRWPEHSIRALADAGLMGLHVPKRLGGEEQGLTSLVVITEAIAKACASSAICFGMHCVGTAVIAAKATPFQEDHYLRPIAEGRHLTSLALSEAGTGVHFYLPQTTLCRENGTLLIEGTKQFVTNGGFADSYVVSTNTGGGNAAGGEFSCAIVDRDNANMTWLDAWHGLGMRGNSSRGLRLDKVPIPPDNLLGREGDQIWYAFEVVAPYFLIAMAGTYLGLAQAAIDTALQHVRARRFDHSGDTLADVPVLQYKVAEMWTELEKSRHLTYHAAQLGDLGDPEAMVALLTCKADVSDMATSVVNQAMTLCGGIAYRENGRLARLLRDARASHVMSPTTDILKMWAGRTLLGLPML